MERLANEAKDNDELARLQWQDRMKRQLVEDILETLANLKVDEDASEEEYQRWASAVLLFLVGEFASGILYAQEKLG